MRRGSLTLTLTLTLGGAGCTVEGIAEDAVFMCDPAHTDAQGRNVDCGDGYVCYTAAASLGFSFCAKACQGTCDQPGYECSGAGGCLKRCKPDAPNACPPGLRCISTSTSGGACVPVAGTCDKPEDCTSTVFNACFGIDVSVGIDVSPGPDGGGAWTSYCLQSGCLAHDTACEPGGTCIRKILPPQIPSPDICAPDCNHDLECPPDMICAARALPASGARICIPDFYGFPCAGAYSCIAGECATLLDPIATASGATLPQRSVCATDCDAQNPCPDVSTSTPDPYSVQACRRNKCQSLFGLTASLTCFDTGATCGGGLGTCESVTLPMGPAPDGGAGACATVGTTNGPPPFCVRECAADADCAAFEQAVGVPLACVHAGAGPLGGYGAYFVFAASKHASLCLPRAPGLPCTDDRSCLPGLECRNVKVPGGGTASICTKDCSKTNGRCDTDDGWNLGPGYACGQALGLDAVCYPKVPAGQPAPSKEWCVSGILDPMKMICLSPSGTACEVDAQCQSGACLHVPACDPHGRCR